MQKDLDAHAKRDAAESKAFLQNLKVSSHSFFISMFSDSQGKNVDASYLKVEKDKRQAKQLSEEQDTARRTSAAQIGEQFLLELLEIELAEQREREEFAWLLSLFSILTVIFLRAKKKSEQEEKERQERITEYNIVQQKLDIQYKQVTRDYLYPKPKEYTPEELMKLEDEVSSLCSLIIPYFFFSLLACC